MFIELHALSMSHSRQLKLHDEMYNDALQKKEERAKVRERRRRSSAANGTISSWLLGSGVVWLELDDEAGEDLFTEIQEAVEFIEEALAGATS